MTLHRLDATRLLCPLPVIRVQDKAESLPPGERLEVLCTDPGALEDIPAWCRINGHRVIKTTTDKHSGLITLLLEIGRG